jgi:hypothetical protein
MDNNILPLVQPTTQDIFRNEWRLQLLSLEKSIGFMDLQLDASLKRIAPQNKEDQAWLNFCKVERPLIMQEAREALRLLRLLSDPQSHCD